MLRRLPALVTAAAALAAGTAVSAAGPAAAAAPSTPCATAASVVRIDGLAFDPPSVAPGGTSAATLTATNCTGRALTLGTTWSGRFLSDTSSGIPAGCPAVDPLPRPVTFAPHERVSVTTGYLVLAGCTADRLRLTVTLSRDGVALAGRTADLLID
ncbi:hypothetical protein [Streptomyces sp. NPDC049040]|uniref:hypothetical protein n=1 Tax=Streptomyces sp. NPDC049040 TaxID=3365593 RepID=UPI003712BCA4